MVLQQYLIPLRTGDERLLIPGWAGELSEEELAFVQERLRRSRRLLRLWKIAARDCPENAIRQVALSGVTEQTKTITSTV